MCNLTAKMLLEAENAYRTKSISSCKEWAIDTAIKTITFFIVSTRIIYVIKSATANMKEHFQKSKTLTAEDCPLVCTCVST